MESIHLSGILPGDIRMSNCLRLRLQLATTTGCTITLRQVIQVATYELVTYSVAGREDTSLNEVWGIFLTVIKESNALLGRSINCLPVYPTTVCLQVYLSNCLLYFSIIYIYLFYYICIIVLLFLTVCIIWVKCIAKCI